MEHFSFIKNKQHIEITVSKVRLKLAWGQVEFAFHSLHFKHSCERLSKMQCSEENAIWRNEKQTSESIAIHGRMTAADHVHRHFKKFAVNWRGVISRKTIICIGVEFDSLHGKFAQGFFHN